MLEDRQIRVNRCPAGSRGQGFADRGLVIVAKGARSIGVRLTAARHVGSASSLRGNSHHTERRPAAPPASRRGGKAARRESEPCVTLNRAMRDLVSRRVASLPGVRDVTHDHQNVAARHDRVIAGIEFHAAVGLANRQRQKIVTPAQVHFPYAFSRSRASPRTTVISSTRIVPDWSRSITSKKLTTEGRISSEARRMPPIIFGEIAELAP